MRVLLAPGGLWPEPAGVTLVGPGCGLPADRVVACLASGWQAVRPNDSLSLMPMADGGPGSVQVIPPERVASREVLQGHGPLGQIREVDLVGLTPRPLHCGSRRPKQGRTWFLDAARLLALPTDPDEGAREALQGSTYGLGQVIGAALRRTRPSDTLLVGLSRSAVHDGGVGALDALGGATAAMDLLAGRSLGLVLADDVALGGMNGAGAALAEVTSLSPEQAQELDRRACAAAMEAVNAADTIRQSSSGGTRLLPVVSVLDGARTSPVPGNLELAGEARVRASTWGTGAAGGSAMVLRSLGAWARPGARVMAGIIDLSGVVNDQDLVVTASGELYDVPADGVVGVVGHHAASQALPVAMVCGRCATTRGELAGAGISNAYSLQELHAAESWDAVGSDALQDRLTDMGARLARTWSR